MSRHQCALLQGLKCISDYSIFFYIRYYYTAIVDFDIMFVNPHYEIDVLIYVLGLGPGTGLGGFIYEPG